MIVGAITKTGSSASVNLALESGEDLTDCQARLRRVGLALQVSSLTSRLISVGLSLDKLTAAGYEATTEGIRAYLSALLGETLR